MFRNFNTVVGAYCNTPLRVFAIQKPPECLPFIIKIIHPQSGHDAAPRYPSISPSTSEDGTTTVTLEFPQKRKYPESVAGGVVRFV